MEKALISDEVYENLPKLLKSLVGQFTEREKDIVLVSSLGILSNCIPNVYGFYNRKINLPHLYIMIIAPAASGKGTMDYSLELIDKIHQKILNDSKLEIAVWEKKKKKRGKPSIKVKILPGNISSSKFYKHLSDSKYGLTIFETEADTISNMLKQEWGDFSDILRKAFHNEKLSLTRVTDDSYLEIKSPKLSMVLSGTPGQVKPLIQSVENGLFSRFLFYYFDDDVKWKGVSPNENFVDYTNVFKSSGDEIFKLYTALLSKASKIEFKLTKIQWEEIDKTFASTTDLLKTSGLEDLRPSVFRIASIQFRVAMILTVIRNMENISNHKVLTCSDIDFKTSQLLIQYLLDHTIKVSELFEKEKNKLSVHEYSILSALPNKFKRAEAIVISGKLSIKNRTMDNYLKRWCEKGVIKKSTYGVYEKIKKKRTL